MSDMRILMVCLGNICRSPTAEAVLRAALEREGLDGRVEVDSAGTGDWHVGAPPDHRMTEAAAAEGITLTGAARQVAGVEDLRDFDLVLAMDRQNLKDLQAMAGGDRDVLDRLQLFRDFADGERGLDVPDPYYGGPEGFANVVGIVRDAAEGVVAHVRRELDGA
jgi:protein-tyrosine phosphatase